MPKTKSIGYWSIGFGGLSLLLFASKPLLLDLIEPAKSLGEVVGENARDILDTLAGESPSSTTTSKRDIWSNVFNVLAFTCFALTVFFSSQGLQSPQQRFPSIAGILLASIGLLLFFWYLKIGILFGLIALVLAVLLVILLILI